MQHLDALTLHHVAAELNQTLQGDRIQRVQHLSHSEFVLVLRRGQRSDTDQKQAGRFYITIQPMFPACCLTSAEALKTFVRPVFQTPTGFCMLLRKHLMGARIRSVETLPGERVLNLHLENTNAIGNRVLLMLSLELMGRHSNLLLVDSLEDQIVGCAHPVTEQMSRYREVAPHMAYLPPPRPEGKSLIFEATESELMRDLGELAGIDPASAPVAGWQRACETLYWGLNRAQWALLFEPIKTLHPLPSVGQVAETIVATLQRWITEPAAHPAIRADRAGMTLDHTLADGPSGLTQDPEETVVWHPMPSVTAMMTAYVSHHVARLASESFRRRLNQALSRQSEKLDERLSHLQPVDAAVLDGFRTTGNLLLNAYSRGELTGRHPHGREVLVSDIATQESHRIAVDPTRSWTENAQQYFKKAKKQVQRAAVYETTRQQLSGRQQYLNELTVMVLQARSLEELTALEADMMGTGLLKAPKQKAGRAGRTGRSEQTSGVRVLSAADGTPICVGRSAQANAWLSGKGSHAEDIWVHVQQMPGAHVVIRTRNTAGVADATLLAAGMLAVFFSSARHGHQVPVVWTRVRQVRHIPDSYPGHVTYRQEQVFFVTPDPGILAAMGISD